MSIALAAAAAFGGTDAAARVTRIVLDPAAAADTALPASATAGAYKRIFGRAFGELDPRDRRNRIIQDLELAPKNANGKVEYVATFQLVVPVDLTRASGLMWHDVPNRGGRITLVQAERDLGDIGLSSGWQGDNSGATAQAAGLWSTLPLAARSTNEVVVVPVAKNANGSTITGRVLGRIVNRSGVDSQPIFVQNSPLPYKPASLDTSQATLETHDAESVDGVVSGVRRIASSDWAWASCGAANPFPGTPSETQICVKGGFDATKLYQVVFTAKDPYVLGIGFAAWRDVGTFFRNEAHDDFGNANPIAGVVKRSIGRGVSQSGNYLRQFIHLGFNQDEARRQVHDGAWPIIAGRRVALNFRWAQPDGVLELYQAGSEGPQWWVPWPDHVRHLPTRGILDRCRETRTCPKIIEHFGSAEVWALKLTPEWVGTDAKRDIPLARNVRRYYIPSTTHGGFNTAVPNSFNTSLPGSTLAPPNCPGNNFGTGELPANPIPHTQVVNALRLHFRNWVIDGTQPPPSVWPRIGRGHWDASAERWRRGHEDDDDDDDDDRRRVAPTRDLVDANKAAMGFPTIPAIAALGATIPSNFIMPVFDYDWGPLFDYSDTSGVPTLQPPPIKRVIRMLVPRTDADGNERGGIPLVWNDAPLGTYLGWNVTAGGARPFHKGQICDYTGGFVPFLKTRAERLAAGDPRLSLEERYLNNAGFVAAVRRAAEKAVAAGFLLQADADRLIAEAAASNVLK